MLFSSWKWALFELVRKSWNKSDTSLVEIRVRARNIPYSEDIMFSRLHTQKAITPASAGAFGVLATTGIACPKRNQATGIIVPSQPLGGSII